jgi:hypothetical protein
MVAGPLADGLVAFSHSQPVTVSEPVSQLQAPLADGLVAFSCSQPVTVSEPVSQLQVLLLMVLWHLPALSL